MYRKALSFSIIIIFTYTAQAQFRQCPDTVIVIDDSVYSLHDSSVFEAISMNYYQAFDSYLTSYVEITDSVGCFLDFISVSGIFNNDLIRYARNNRCCTKILQDDSTSTLLIGNGEISIVLSNPVVCNPSVEGSHNRYMVKIFDSKGRLSDKDRFYNAFVKQRRSFYRKYKGRERQFKYYYSDETNSERLIVVIYRFDYDTGLSLITSCQRFHELQQNDYIKSLTEFVDSFCRKKHLSKIIFSGLMLND